MSAKTTYKDLFRLVHDQITKGQQYTGAKRFRNQLDRTDIGPIFNNPVSDVRTSEVVSSVQELLNQALPGFIIEGLEVTQLDTPTSKVLITAGKGSTGGTLYQLNDDTTLNITFDSTTTVYYVSLFKDRIMVEKEERENALLIAKIIVPVPGQAFRIFNRKDQRDDETDAYIISRRDKKLYVDSFDNLEEDTVEFSRDNIGPVLADNIIGNIRLSEDLKITNTQGSLELDSKQIKLYNSSGTVLAKFNKNGTFYYNSDGIEVARFTTTDAKIGNILITKNSIQSGNFISESRGFKIQDDGYAEFENVRVRGRISSSVFEYDKVSAVGGKLFIGKATALEEDMTALDASTLVAEDAQFNVGDILYIKEGNDEEYLEVTDDTNEPTYTVTRDLSAGYSADSNPAWSAGTAVVSLGNANSNETPGFIN